MTPLILGTGITGIAAAEFCQDKANEVFVYTDTDDGLAEKLNKVDCVIASPGFDPAGKVIQQCLKAKLPVISDIELFAKYAKAPIIAITGTNGKSTVATMVFEILKAAGKKALLGGNIGISALSLLKEPVPDFYVLEISSFQLQLTDNLSSIAATVLNISPDHLDRHGTLFSYQQCKEKIFKHCQTPVLNAQMKYQSDFGKALYFDIEKPFVQLDSTLSRHDQENALAAIRLCQAAGIDAESNLQALKHFNSLPYRCEHIPTNDRKTWINDSKGTNIGATIAAIKSCQPKSPAKLFLLLGGVGKEQDFSTLDRIIQKYHCQCLIFGQDREKIASAISVQTTKLETLDQAILLAQKETQAGDTILFSPACASFDQFANYMVRGAYFNDAIQTA